MSRSSDPSRRPRLIYSVAKDFVNSRSTAFMTADSHFFKLGVELGLPLLSFYHLSAIPCRFFDFIYDSFFNSLAISVTLLILVTFSFFSTSVSNPSKSLASARAPHARGFRRHVNGSATVLGSSDYVHRFRGNAHDTRSGFEQEQLVLGRSRRCHSNSSSASAARTSAARTRLYIGSRHRRRRP